ncbi:IgGFc-binding protein [Strongylocentrotus purpuratus]|uniref:Fibronectin type-III domain-containing protein n=1 Tax=Strongylocentrotus purpuratus TaxID=7668 RepID=A0A7M7GFP0_STRPU|nr:IgGFc-binding protein [Strongylocentrotus purpuratus]|eukprot:XP_003724011.1 PREDICTED: IgGFc-binding protein [Strongylocentrotus purpuratus]
MESRVLLYLFVLGFALDIQAFIPSTAGTDFVIPAFYATYGDDVVYDENPKVYISGVDSSASINLTVPGQDKSLHFSVGEGCTIPVLLNCRLSAKQVGTQTSALHLVSDAPIAVRMHQEHLVPNMPTSFLSLPTSMLGTNYFVVDPGNEESPTELIITAAEGRAEVTITPSSVVDLDGMQYDEGDDFRVNLQRFESLILRSDGDLTGTEIVSDNPVSVIVGDHCDPNMPGTTLCRQPHQLLPTNLWGKRYVVTTFTSSEDSVYQIFAISDQTTVRLLGGGSEVASALIRGESSLERARPNNIYVVESDKPVYVLHYEGDGQALTALTPDSHRVAGSSSVPAITASNRNAQAHLLITTDCASPEGFKLDLEELPRSKSIVRATDDVDCVIRVPVDSGNHVLHHESPDATYSVTVHVTDDEMSYAYPVGFSVNGIQDSNEELRQDDTPVTMFENRPKRKSGVMLTWKKPSSWPGQPQGYRIQIKSARDPGFCQCRNVIIYNPRRTNYWIRNLSVGERYIVGIRPFGTMGSGASTMQVIRRTV